MIYPDYLEKEVIKFCEINNIPIKDGNIPTFQMEQVETFLKQRLAKERQATKRREEENELSIKQVLQMIIGKCKIVSPIEEYLLKELIKQDLNKYCQPHFRVGDCEIDFAFPIAKLGVECDGEAYHRANQLQIERDQKRDKYLARKGWRILRIEGLAIRRNINLCIDKIKEGIKFYIPELSEGIGTEK